MATMRLITSMLADGRSMMAILGTTGSATTSVAVQTVGNQTYTLVPQQAVRRPEVIIPIGWGGTMPALFAMQSLAITIAPPAVVIGWLNTNPAAGAQLLAITQTVDVILIGTS